MRLLILTFVALLSTGMALGQSVKDASPESSSSTSSTSSAPPAAYGYIPLVGTSQGAETGMDSSNPNTPWLPVLINGETPVPAFSGELERGNQISGGMTLASGYDDNALTEQGRQIGNTSFSFLPTLAWEQSWPRGLFDFSYSPGFTVNQRLSELNSSTQNAGLSAQFRLTEYLTLRLHDAFVATNNAWTGTNSETPGDVLHQPNQNVLIPLAKTTSNQAGTDLIYCVGDGTIVGGSSSYSLLSYGNLQGGPGVQLIDSRTTGAEIFYQHRFFPKHWIGLTYGFQRLNFNGGVEDTQSQTALLFDTMTIQPHLTLSLFAGATHSHTDGFVTIGGSGTLARPTPPQWSPNAGATLAWAGEHTGITATLSRRIDSGGGILGTVDRLSMMATLRRQFSPRWTGTINLIYDDNRPLDGVEFGYRTVSGTASVQRQITRQMTVSASYARVHQTYGVVVPTQLFPDHNRALLSVSYLFNRPLGR